MVSVNKGCRIWLLMIDYSAALQTDFAISVFSELYSTFGQVFAKMKTSYFSTELCFVRHGQCVLLKIWKHAVLLWVKAIWSSQAFFNFYLLLISGHLNSSLKNTTLKYILKYSLTTPMVNSLSFSFFFSHSTSVPNISVLEKFAVALLCYRESWLIHRRFVFTDFKYNNEKLKY